MIEELLQLSPILLAFFATLFTYFLTMLGASVVFFFKDVNQKFMDGMLSFGAGVMIAASFFSLLEPALIKAEEMNQIGWLVVTIGFICGGILVILADKFLSLILKKKNHEASLKRNILLTFAVTLHNIPEGLAVGVAFGALAMQKDASILIAALMLAFGIGIQNFPEGASISLPLRRDGNSLKKSFFIGQISGIVEPIAGIIGCFATIHVANILPFVLAFSSGAMIAVCASELIPEASKSNKNFATLLLILGFSLMMLLDVALG